MITKSVRTKNIYIVDYEESDRAYLAQFLRSHDFIVHPCKTSTGLIAGLKYLPPSCVLLDASFAESIEFDIITTLGRYRTHFPVVAMSGQGAVLTAVGAMKAGATDVIEKPIDHSKLLAMLTTIFASLDAEVREDDRCTVAHARLAALTTREKAVLKGLAAGRSNKLLAHDFGISIRTVEMHRASMMDRLGVKTLAEALRIAFESAMQADVARAA